MFNAKLKRLNIKQRSESSSNLVTQTGGKNKTSALQIQFHLNTP